MPAVVVTGAQGQLGRATVDRILRQRETVYAYDRLPGDDLPGPFSTLDLTQLPEGFQWPPDAEVVLHLAGFRDAVATTGGDLEILLRANLEALGGALGACGEGVRHVVYVSSMSVYSGQAPVPTAEDGPVAPGTMYGVSKWLGEQACRIFQRARPEVGLTVVRLAQVYGPGSPGHLALYQLIEQALTSRRAQLTCVPELVRDMIYLDDAADALALAVHHRPQRIVNVSGAAPFTMGQLVDHVEAALGIPLEKKFGVQRGEDRALSVAEFRQCTGFTPSISLREGVAREVRRIASARGLL